MRYYISLLLILFGSYISLAQNDGSSKKQIIINIKENKGDIIKGNKVINNIKLDKPNITIINTKTKPAIKLVADTIYTAVDSSTVIGFIFSDEYGQYVPNPKFILQFDRAVDTVIVSTVGKGMVYNGGALRMLTYDKKRYAYNADFLCAGCAYEVFVYSKYYVKTTVTL